MSRADLYSLAHADRVGVCKSQFRGLSLTAAGGMKKILSQIYFPSF